MQVCCLFQKREENAESRGEKALKIINLMEDTKGSSECIAEHGLSFYIETEKHKLLMDTGATENTWKNADRLGVDLTKIDTVILSHGHYDHTGGLLSFIEINPTAKIYMQRKAGGDYYNFKEGWEKYIGIDKRILELSQLQLVDGEMKIDDELFLFSGIVGRKHFAKSNLVLKQKVKGQFQQDDFEHEQCLVVKQQEKYVLLSGCAHNGMINILDRYREIYSSNPDMVISGFHLMQKEEYSEEEIRNIAEIAEELKRIEARFYTGHCTGLPAYKIMKEIMGEQLEYVHSGDKILTIQKDDMTLVK